MNMIAPCIEHLGVVGPLSVWRIYCVSVVRCVSERGRARGGDVPRGTKERERVSAGGRSRACCALARVTDGERDGERDAL